jgi:hypothetical protein
MTATPALENISRAQPTQITPPAPLPEDASPMDSARFSQLLTQAREEQAQVELTNPASSVAAPTIDAAMKGISASSTDFLGTVDKGLKALSTVNLRDPKSIANLVQHFTMAQVQSVQLSAVLGEVSNSKKSLQTLFQNQG